MIAPRCAVAHKFIKCAAFGVVALAMTASVADAALNPDREIQFASGLIDMGFPDYARKVVDKLLLERPDVAKRTKVVDAQILISRGKLDEARTAAVGLPSGSAELQQFQLALANGYYRRGDLDKARAVYGDFFKSFKGGVIKDEMQREFYQDAVWKFGQMLENSGKFDEALKIYAKVKSSGADKSRKRLIDAHMADLYIKAAERSSGKKKKAYLNKCIKLCKDIQWGGLDLYFGGSISTMARAQLLLGDEKGAQKTLKDSVDLLRKVDDLIKEQDLPMALSPMAGARFMLGELYTKQAAVAAKKGNSNAAVKLYGSALKEFYNVFVKYSEHELAPEAGIRGEEIVAILRDDYGKNVKVNLGGNKVRGSAQVYKIADQQFREKNYEEAVQSYVRMLNAYPEDQQAPAAITSLMKSYAELDDDLMVRASLSYLGERFSGNPAAARGVLSMGGDYFKKKNKAMYLFAYENYIKFFPQDERMGMILYTLGGMAKKEGDKTAANRYFDLLLGEYGEDQYAIKAQSQVAWSAYADKDYKRAIPAFTEYLKISQAGPEKVKAKFCLGDCYVKEGSFSQAIATFEELSKWLADARNPYNTSVAAAKANADFKEKAQFFLGYSNAKIAEPEAEIAAYRKTAVAIYEQFLKLYPKSDVAPKAMAMLGALQLGAGDFDAAQGTFAKLAKDYPDSPEGEDALFSLVSAAMEVGKAEIAQKALLDMLSQPDKYSPRQFARVGTKMSEGGLYKEALTAFAPVLSKKPEELGDDERSQRAVLETLYYQAGKSHFELGQYAEAREQLNALMGKYPKSALFYDAKFMLADANLGLKDFDAAQSELADIMKFAGVLDSTRASLKLSDVQESRGDKKAALASLLRVALLGDESNEEIRPYVEQAIIDSVALQMELEMYKDAADSVDDYAMKFKENEEKVAELRQVRKQALLKAAAQ